MPSTSPRTGTMTPAVPLTAAQERALDLLRAGQRFLLVGHVRPDGDCLGSQAALVSVLEALGKEAVVLNPDVPDARYDYLLESGPFRTYTGGALPEHDVLVSLDINELSRCAGLQQPLEASPAKKMVIDHHPHEGQPWWDEAFVDISASATGLLVWRIGKALGIEPDQRMARAVFTALVTDTGWFRYSNTDAETMAAASELVERGVEPSQMYGFLYQRNRPEQPQAIGALLQRLEYFADGRLAMVDMPLDTVDRSVDSDPVLDIVRAVDDVEVVLYLRELEADLWKLSARSKSTYNVNLLARRFGGGGHVKASGATLRGSREEVRSSLLEAAMEAFAGGPA